MTAEQLSEQTSDAYSFDRYGAKRWTACIRMLMRRGFDAREIEAIMRSTDNLRGLILRYIRAGRADNAAECARTLVRVLENRHEGCGCCQWERSSLLQLYVTHGLTGFEALGGKYPRG